VEYLTELGEVQDLATWVHEQIMNHIAQGGQIKDMDLMHLPIQPQFYASRYTWIRSYGNHFRVCGDTHMNTSMATYDSSVASVFQQQQESQEGTTLGSVQYVGVLRDIILMDYGPVS